VSSPFFCSLERRIKASAAMPRGGEEDDKRTMEAEAVPGTNMNAVRGQEMFARYVL
jgi:hypothetical protein